jgi:hypothetical protein
VPRRKITKKRNYSCCVIYGRFNIRSKSAYNTNNYGLSVDGMEIWPQVILALLPGYTVSAVEYGCWFIVGG